MDYFYEEKKTFESKKLLGETEDILLQRLGKTYGVLRRIGFSEPRVNECLNSMAGVDIDEALDWVRYHITHFIAHNLLNYQ